MWCQSFGMSKTEVSAALIAIKRRPGRNAQSSTLRLLLSIAAAAVMMILPQESTAAALPTAADSGNTLHVHEHTLATSLEWHNPCGGDGNQMDFSGQRAPISHYLKQLHKVLAMQRHALKQQQVIKIDDIEDYKLHSGTYKFLPKLKTNPAIRLKRWYRKMQIYVASFALLKQQQHTWESSHQLPRSGITQELHNMHTSAQQILCEIETAINGSYSLSSAQLNVIDREQMYKILRPLRQDTVHPQRANPIALRFAKYMYLQLVEDMENVLDVSDRSYWLSSDSSVSAEEAANNVNKSRKGTRALRGSRQNQQQRATNLSEEIENLSH